MTNGEFREWLKGFFELAGDEAALDIKRLQVIVNHLNLAEAVEGKLDEKNQHLRNEIEAFRKNPGDFALLTESLKQQVLF